MSIVNCHDKKTRNLWAGKAIIKWKSFSQVAQEKLIELDRAKSLFDLAKNPSNRLHSLRGKRKGQHSISIDEKWRICFIWESGNAYEVEIVDYHDERK